LGNDYVVFGPDSEQTFRIVITGGSTSASFGIRSSWPEQLANLFREDGYCVQVFSGGVPGYSTNQEMLKILRDRYSLRPNLHITYNGANEAREWNYYPTIYSYQLLKEVAKFRESFFLPNTVSFLSRNLQVESAIEGVSVGLPQAQTDFENWAARMREMRALAREFNYEFLGVLQPILGIGSYEPAAEERQRIKDGGLDKKWHDFYSPARQFVAKSPQMADFVDLFRGRGGLYTDDCHVLEEGNHLIAEEMHRVLLERYGKQLASHKKPCQ
jgi:hypothetical protein